MALLTGACSSGVSDEAAEQVLARCGPVSQATLDYIETGPTFDNGTLSHAAAATSDHGATLWVIGAQFNGDGFDGDQYVGIWAVVDGIEVSEITKVAAADEFTKGISTWGRDFGADLALVDGVSAAGACVTASQNGEPSTRRRSDPQSDASESRSANQSEPERVALSGPVQTTLRLVEATRHLLDRSR